MAQIRMPINGRPVLQYCKNHNAKLEDAFFPSYAHLMIFAASLGWSSEEFDDSPELCEKDPYPIPLEIFKNLGLYDAILIMALAKTRNFEVAKSDTETAVIVEGLASAGFRQMGKIYGKCEGYEFLQEWVDVIIKENVESKQ